MYIGHSPQLKLLALRALPFVAACMIAIRTPNTKNPPGGRLKKPIEKFGMIVKPRRQPVPRSYLIAPMAASASVNPIPMPIPSRAESTTVFLFANASARPRMMQFTTIRGMNTPRALLISGA